MKNKKHGKTLPCRKIIVIDLPQNIDPFAKLGVRANLLFVMHLCIIAGVFRFVKGEREIF